MTLEQILQLIAVVMGKAMQFGPGKAATVINTGMIETIGKNHIMTPHQRRNNPNISQVAAAKKQGRLPLLELGQSCFQLTMQL